MRPVAIRTMVCLGAIALITSQAFSQPQTLGPGLHENLPTLANPDWKFTVLIPPQAGDADATKLPVIFLWGRDKDWTIETLTEWAQERGVIVVANRSRFKYDDEADHDKMIDAIDATVTQRANVHPYLQFAIGRMEGVPASFRMGARQGKDIAGVGVLEPYGELLTPLPSFQSVGMLQYSTLDDEELALLLTAKVYHTQRKNNVKVFDEPLVRKQMSFREAVTLAEWLLWTGKLQHPGLTKEEVEANKAQLDALLLDYANGSPKRWPSTLIKQGRQLLAIPGATESINAPAAIKLCFDAHYNEAMAEEDELNQHDMLTHLSRETWFEACAAEDQKKVNSRLKQLRSTSPIREEWAAQQEYDEISKLELPLRLGQVSPATVIRRYQALAKKYPETFAGGAAAGAVNRLTKAAQQAAEEKNKRNR